jgi:membrane-bound serine protease (ClpP class)
MLSRSRLILRLTLTFIIICSYASVALPSYADAHRVDVITVNGDINPSLARYIQRGIAVANDAGASAVIIQLDTPGGLDSAMRDIIKSILASDVPVVVWVGPSGSRAASAGTFITLAAHIASMAPGTEIGAAHPVTAQGGDIEGAIEEKVVNDAVAYIRSLAELHGRNADWAEEAVTKSASLGANSAARENVIDMIVPDIPSLIQAIDGRIVNINGRDITIHTSSATTHFTDMTLIEDFLFTLSNPNIAFLLLSLSSLALFFELANPGTIFPGAIGALGILIALFSLGTLPVNWAGVLLIGLAFVLFFLELYVTSYGILAIGGIIALTFGALILIGGDAPPSMHIDKRLIAVVVSGISLFLIVAIRIIVKDKNRLSTFDNSAMIGQEAETLTDLTPKGIVFVQGARWQATVSDGHVQARTTVVITQVKGLHLRVVSQHSNTDPEVKVARHKRRFPWGALL